MAGLFSLPNEIITQIYILAGHEPSALVRLSAVNRRLRALWLQDSDYIIAQSLELKTPGHQDAITFTMMELCCPPLPGFHYVDHSQDDPMLRLHLPRLMRTVHLASTTCEGISEWQSKWKDYSLTYPLPPLYYLMRQLVIAYHYPGLRRSLCAALKGLSEGSLGTLTRFNTYLQSDDRTDLHGINDMEAEPEPRDDEQIMFDYPANFPLKQCWGFAFEVGWKLESDREDGIDREADDDFYPYGGLIEEEATGANAGIKHVGSISESVNATFNIDSLDYCEELPGITDGIAEAGADFFETYNEDLLDRVNLKTEPPSGEKRDQVFKKGCGFYMKVIRTDCTAVGDDSVEGNWNYGGVKYSIEPSEFRRLGNFLVGNGSVWSSILQTRG